MINKIVLGTVQFGLNYGINNISGKPCRGKVFGILDEAYNKGIRYLDTAETYGNAIEIIGQYHKQTNNRFKVLSKFKNAENNTLYNNVSKTLETLSIPKFEVYSYHSFKEYVDKIHLRDDILKLKHAGLIEKIGISIYTNQEFDYVIKDKEINVIQLPYNILDNDNIRGNLIEKAKNNHKEIHVRSVFLQGVFFLNINNLPSKLGPLRKYLLRIMEYCKDKNITIDKLALNYVLQNSNIDKVILGVDSKEQLQANIDMIDELNESILFIDQEISVLEKELLNPVNWKK